LKTYNGKNYASRVNKYRNNIWRHLLIDRLVK